MPQSRSKFEFRQQASLSQKLSYKDPIYQKLAGSDPTLSDSIGVLLVMCENGLLDKNDPSIKLILEILDVQRKSRFATSERTNEITKMGMQMPKAESEVDFSEDTG